MIAYNGEIVPSHENLLTFHMRMLISYCEPPTLESGVIAAPIAIALLVWINPEQT
jgi:hypothetical protein